MLTDLFLKFREASKQMLLGTIVLTIVGLVSISSVSQHQDMSLVHTTYFRQLLWTIPAFLTMILSFGISRRNIYKFSYPAYALVILLLLVPYLGPKVAGTYRWIKLGTVHLQPSEIAKIFIVLALARYLSNPRLDINGPKAILVPSVLVLVPIALVFQQPDLGTSIIIASPVIIMLFWAGVRPFSLFLIIAPVLSILTAFHNLSFGIWATVMALILYLARPKLVNGVIIYFANLFLGLLSPYIWNALEPYQQKRVMTVFDPSLDPLGAGYQIIQSQTAIGSGGLLGKGWGQGTQTQLKFLPVQETDFIVSVIGEEFGFLMVLVILIIFALLLLRMLRLAADSDNRFSSLVIVGLAVLFLAHLFVNMAMAVGLIPVKGLPLPFISYGGSFLVACFAMVGLVMNLGINYSD